MPRIGIFIDALQGSVPASFREKISGVIQGLPDIAFCMEEENLTAPGTLEKAAKRLEWREVDRAVIIGGSPKLYETAFQKRRQGFPLNPYLFAVANVREQALGPMADEHRAFEKALALDPEDGPSAEYLKRSRIFKENPPPENWDGVFTMTTK